MAIRMARCYRTVSAAAALVIAEMAPGNLLARDERRCGGSGTPDILPNTDKVAADTWRQTIDEWQAW